MKVVMGFEPVRRPLRSRRRGFSIVLVVADGRDMFLVVGTVGLVRGVGSGGCVVRRPCAYGVRILLTLASGGLCISVLDIISWYPTAAVRGPKEAEPASYLLGIDIRDWAWSTILIRQEQYRRASVRGLHLAMFKQVQRSALVVYSIFTIIRDIVTKAYLVTHLVFYSLIENTPRDHASSPEKRKEQETIDMAKEKKQDAIDEAIDLQTVESHAVGEMAASAELRRDLRPHQVFIFSIACAIGTGLVIGSGTALSRGGPASMLIAYLLIGAVVFFVMTALGEMASFAPMKKGFGGYATRMVDPAFGYGYRDPP